MKASTFLAPRFGGIVDELTPVNVIRVAATPIPISSAAERIATTPGFRITVCERRYQKPSCSYLAVRSAARRQRLGEPLFRRGPRAASRAGRATRAVNTATREHTAPPIPIERMNGCSNTINEPMTTATVRALKKLVRPAVFLV